MVLVVTMVHVEEMEIVLVMQRVLGMEKAGVMNLWNKLNRLGIMPSHLKI